MNFDISRVSRAAECFDVHDKLIGRYIYLNHEDQETLDLLCDVWLDTYKSNENFFLTLDLETSGLKPHEGDILLFSISWDGNRSIVFSPLFLDLTKFKEVLNVIPLNNHNIKFDIKWLKYHYKVEPKIFLDTMVATQMCWAGSFPSAPLFSLDKVAKHLLQGYELEKETRNQFIGMTKNHILTNGFTEEQISYAAKDSLITHKLVIPISKRMSNQGLTSVWEEIERPLIEALVDSELNGVLVDIKELTNRLVSKEKELLEKYNLILQELKKFTELPKFPKNSFNPGSSKQILEVLNLIGLKPLNTEKATLQSLLATNPNNLLKYIIDWRNIKSQISKFLTKWLEEHVDPITNRIYTSFNTYGSETGRLSCKEPNLMQVPSDLRSLIIAPPDHKILSLDFSQFEFRAAAAITEEPYLMEAFQERAVLLPEIKKLASNFGYLNPDDFVKISHTLEKKLSYKENQLIKQFIKTDIHRRNAALILKSNIDEITNKQRSIGKCVDIDSLVFTNKGLFKLRDFLPKKLKKDTYYDLSNIKVLTDVGYREAPTIYYFGKSPVLKIKTSSGRTLRCTKIHRFRTYDKKGEYSWVKAGKLKKGQEIILKLNASFEGTIEKAPLGLTTQKQITAFARLVGMFIRAGEIKDNYILFPLEEEEFLESIISSLKLNDVKIKKLAKHPNSIQLVSPSLVEYFLSTLKDIPDYFLRNAKENILIALLSEMIIQTDQRMLQFAYDNLELLSKIQHLLSRLGINSKLTHPTHDIKGICTLKFSTQDEKLIYHLFFNGPPVENNFFRNIKVLCSSKTLETLLDNGYFGQKPIDEGYLDLIPKDELDQINFLINNSLVKDSIISIEEDGEVEVGDFSVPSNSTVVYNGFVTHNTLGYAVLYGAGAPRAQVSLSEAGFYHTLQECSAFLEDFFNHLPRVKEFIAEVHRKVINPGYITTLMGRKRFFELPPKYLSNKYKKESEAAFREATNYVFQGTNADATKMAANSITDYTRKFPENRRPYIALTVHDEIVLPPHNDHVEEMATVSEQIMVDCGGKTIGYKVPMEVSVQIADHWSK